MYDTRYEVIGRLNSLTINGYVEVVLRIGG